jgi:hypothetical protein
MSNDKCNKHSPPAVYDLRVRLLAYRNSNPVSSSTVHFYSGNKYCVHYIISGRAMGQALSRRPLAAEAGFNSRPIHVRFVVHNVVLRQIFLPVLWFPVSIIPPRSTLIHSSIRSFVQSFVPLFITNTTQSSRMTAPVK